MKLVRLTADYPLLSFDCGDEDLNEFLLDDTIEDYWKSVEENQGYIPGREEIPQLPISQDRTLANNFDLVHNGSKR